MELKPIGSETVKPFNSEISPITCEECGREQARIHPYGDEESVDICWPCSEKKEALAAKQEQIARGLAKQKALALTIEKRLRDCCIGERFMGATFGDYKPTCPAAKKVLSACVKYVAEFEAGSGANILMMGTTGTGKNMMAAIIGQEIIKRGHTFHHTTALKLVRKIKSSWRDKSEQEQDVINMFVQPEILAIDEIGVQFGSTTEQLYLTEVINERYEKKRPTILISNLALPQLTEIIGGRVIDRFYDNGSLMLVFDWPSYRRSGDNAKG